MAKFAKLFDLENGEQILFAKDYNVEEKEPYRLKITVQFDGVTANLSLIYKTEKDQQHFFDKVNKERAEVIYKGLENKINK